MDSNTTRGMSPSEPSNAQAIKSINDTANAAMSTFARHFDSRDILGVQPTSRSGIYHSATIPPSASPRGTFDIGIETKDFAESDKEDVGNSAEDARDVSEETLEAAPSQNEVTITYENIATIVQGVKGLRLALRLTTWQVMPFQTSEAQRILSAAYTVAKRVDTLSRDVERLSLRIESFPQPIQDALMEPILDIRKQLQHISDVARGEDGSS
ncbi:hypothetical protein N7492_006532 [Penicillium capsulatum]|uniref:Uncharacterized protein n=1 Tax=Penicillium capsulatum TaxID=69766 RepID=A0A9W9I325_9EURO|nr:hypothetical protein N7492_006532 [Penicillium capsulatum]KAJ6116368.1 hypothetical protein N7512_006093 [Penicillium capsulatum]